MLNFFYIINNNFMNKKTFLSLPVLLIAALTLSGCQPAPIPPSTPNNNNSETPNNQNETVEIELGETSWLWIQTTMKDGSIVKPVKSDAFILSFQDDGNMSSSTDCNGLGGTYELKNNQLNFSPFMQTLMLCAESQETEYVSTLSKGGSVNITGDTLTISSDLASMEFAKTEAPELITEEPSTNESSTPDLAGTSWQWVETAMNDGTTTQSAKPEAFVLSFDQDGKVSSSTDCNSISSTYTSNQGELIFGPLAMTKMFCEGSQEGVYAKALGEVQSYLVNGDTLSLALKLDSGIMEFTKVN
jgi:heat shock protein HslJ